MSKIIAIQSSQGGAGKSNITANVAAQIALRGRRVGVVDGDLQTPGIHIAFGLGESEWTLNDFLLGLCAVEKAAYDVGARCGPRSLPRDALYLVPAGAHTQELSQGIRGRYSITPLSDGLLTLAEKLQLDYVLVDSHTGFSEDSLLVMALCDLLLLILGTDQKDLQGTAALLGVARKLELSKILLVANMVLPTYDCVHLRAELERVYGCPVATVLPFCAEVMLLGSRGLFSLRAPEDPFSRGIVEIAEKIVRSW